MARDYRQVLDAVLAGVVVIDQQGVVEQVNSAACRILEISTENILGAPVGSLLGAEHAISRLAQAVLASGRTAVENDQPVERRRDADLFVDVSVSPLFDAAGHPDGAVLMLRDRTLQNRLQAVVDERERQASFGRIAAGLAHEVKNPLGGIRGAAELLGMRAADAKTGETAELIVREVDRITSLVDELMVLGRGDSLRLETLNLHRMLDRVMELLALDPASTGIQVKRRFDPSIPEFQADGDRLTQVFLNLGRNALQAMSARGGTLTFETAMSLDERIATPEDDHCRALLVTIRDTGEGIPNDLLGKISTPFFTTRKEGTGLGLAIAGHWVGRHLGSTRIESVEGRGTTVVVTLPLRRMM